jgi:hypothetical protein
VQELLHRLRELKSLTESHNDDESLNITRNGTVAYATRCTVGGARDVVGMLEAGVQPIDSLLASIRALAGFFYPVENLTYTDQLGYYRQREWRITANLVSQGVRVTEELHRNMIEYLVESDNGFFGREMDFPTGRQSRASQCQLYSRFRGQPVYMSVRRIIVPSSASDRANALLVGKAIGIPLTSIEDL